jgi:hypothetical protein
LQLLIVSAHIEKTIRTFVGYPVLDLFFRKLLGEYIYEKQNIAGCLKCIAK